MRVPALATVLIVSISILISGCETSSNSDGSAHTTFKLAQPGEGYILFSLTYAGEIEPPGDENVLPYFNNYILKVRPAGDFYSTYEIGLTPANHGRYRSKFNVSNGKGFLFAEPLPAGEYEIYSYELSYKSLTKSAAISPQAYASIPFTVSEGQYTYLGRIQCQHLFENLETDWTNVIRPSGVTFSWSDELAEDKSQTIMEFPHLIPLELAKEDIGKKIVTLNGPVNSYLP